MSDIYSSDSENDDFSEISSLNSSEHCEIFEEEDEEYPHDYDEDFNDEEQYYLEDYEKHVTEEKRIFQKVDTSIPAVNPWKKNTNDNEISKPLSIAEIIELEKVEKKKRDEIRQKNLKKRAKFSFAKSQTPKQDNNSEKKSLLLGRKISFVSQKKNGLNK